MKLQKRIKQIVSLTVEDFYNSGYNTDETKESLISWLTDALMQDETIEDAYTYEVTLKALEMLKSLDIVDLGFIVELIADDIKPSDMSVSFEVVL